MFIVYCLHMPRDKDLVYFIPCCILRTRTVPEIERVPINISFMNELERFTRGGAGENLSFLQAG